MVDTAVEQDEIQNVLHQLPLLKNFYRRNADALGVDGVGVRCVGARYTTSHVVVVRDIGHIGHHLSLVEDGRCHGDIR